MSLNAGIGFFDRSMCLAQDGAVAAASSGDASASRALDRNPYTYWRSVSSNDMTTETLQVTFDDVMTFSRLFLIDHNFKEFGVQWDDTGVWTDFANVTNLDGTDSNISETTYARDTAYYEFDSVTTQQIRISVLKTQVVDAQKYLNQVIVTNELGTLVGHPVIKGTEISRNLRAQKMLSGRKLTMKSDDFFSVDLDFKTYPSSLSADIDLMFSLADREDTFLVWLCGGKFGSNFRKQMRGYRLRDVIPVQMNTSIKPIYSDNVFVNTVNFSVGFDEAVD